MIFRRSKKQDAVPKKKKPLWREWLDAGVFALIVSTVFRMFIAEAYAIPSGSMEGSMLINDHLYVNKMIYGPRLPMTPLALPLVHNTMPFTGGRSYTDAVQWSYHRLPGYGKVEHNDIVVFNGPDGDTAIADDAELDYYQACRLYGREAVYSQHTIVTHPVDKKDNLIKRCIGLPGDVITIKNAQVYLNGQPAANNPHAKHTYLVKTNGMAPGIDDDVEMLQPVSNNIYACNIQNRQLDDVKKAPNVVSADLWMKEPAGTAPSEPGEWVFPLDTANYKWNRDNYGPLTVPKAGATVQLTPQNIALYRRIIANYEHNTLQERNGRFIINGKETNSYMFKMNYYWMMGDNRDNSLDSRYWGFVPDDHIVGKAWFVWYSYDSNPFDIRWNRILRSITALQK